MNNVTDGAKDFFLDWFVFYAEHLLEYCLHFSTVFIRTKVFTWLFGFFYFSPPWKIVQTLDYHFWFVYTTGGKDGYFLVCSISGWKGRRTGLGLLSNIPWLDHCSQGKRFSAILSWKVLINTRVQCKAFLTILVTVNMQLYSLESCLASKTKRCWSPCFWVVHMISRVALCNWAEHLIGSKLAPRKARIPGRNINFLN